MSLCQIYECFADETRLRIIHLLSHGPLCVSDLQAILHAPQVNVSKHLAYLRTRGLVQRSRDRNRMIYRLVSSPAAEVEANLKCLSACVREHPVFQRDLAARHQLDDALRRAGHPAEPCRSEGAPPVPGGAEAAPVPTPDWLFHSGDDYID